MTLTATHPDARDPITKLSRPDGSTGTHPDDHARLIEIAKNPMGYGAKGDGSADDSSVINTLLANEQYVYMPGRPFKIGSRLTIQAGQHLFGAGRNKTILRTFQGSDPAIYFSSSGGNYPVTLRDFSVGMDPAHALGVPTATGHGIHLSGPVDGASGVTIQRVRFDVAQGAAASSSWCIYNENFLETLVDDCNVVNSIGGGFAFIGNSNMSAVRNCVLSNGGFGTLGGILNQAEKLLVQGSVIEAWRGSYGLRCDSAGGTRGSSAELFGTWFEDNYGYELIVDRGCALDGFGINATSAAAGSYTGTAQVIAGGTTDTWLQLFGGFTTGKFALANAAGQPVHLGLYGHFTTATLDTTGIIDSENLLATRQGGRAANFPNEGSTSLTKGTRLARTKIALTDAATVATDASRGDFFTLSTSSNRTMGAPTNPQTGQSITYDITNGSGGAITTTWNAAFHLAGAWTDPAASKRRTITFYYDGTNWIETNRAAGDIS